jgi:hypothetical protein
LCTQGHGTTNNSTRAACGWYNATQGSLWVAVFQVACHEHRSCLSWTLKLRSGETIILNHTHIVLPKSIEYSLMASVYFSFKQPEFTVVQCFAGCMSQLCKLPIVRACEGGCCGIPHNRVYIVTTPACMDHCQPTCKAL